MVGVAAQGPQQTLAGPVQDGLFGVGYNVACVPDFDLGVKSTRDQLVAVRAESDGAQTIMPELHKRLPRDGIPQAYGAAAVAGGQQPSVRTEGQAIHLA